MEDRIASTELAGVRFPHLDLETATARLLSAEGRADATPWRLVNTYNISLMRKHAGYAAVLRGPGVNLADGKPVAWALRVLSRRDGSPGPGHVRGPSLFGCALDRGRASGVRHYLLGGTPEALAALQTAIADRFPGASIAGAESPPFRSLSDEERATQDDRIRASGADLVWVGLGTPRQDMEAARLARAVGRPAVAVGAAFDFLAGTQPEAPVWMRRLALEWLFRLVSEPKRLWKRYTVGFARFCLAVAPDLLPRRRDRATAGSAGGSGPQLRDQNG
jgi:N-acetylglucosaminyldiphosphoundecaprenol N-acetyl-beta-D-mannosaminyltransferase